MFKEGNENLLRRLNALPVSFRVAFAALCAERIAPAYRPYAEYMEFEDTDLPSSILDGAWEGIATGIFEEARFARWYNDCLALLPHEEEGEWSHLRIYAEAALSAVAYVAEICRNGESQNAVWSANNVAEAVSDFVERKGYEFGKGPEVRARFYAHPVTKQELDYQWQELAALEARAPSLIPRDILSAMRRQSQANAYQFLAEASPDPDDFGD